ncbi:MAG: ribosome biosis GTPase Der [Actinomycetota bacterium]
MSDEFDPELAQAQAEVLRDELDEYELDEEDYGLLDLELADEYEPGYRPAPPVLAIVGRPNVGKSALVNRILGRREAVVEDKPGITRDRVSYRAEWNGRPFTLVDTGGWEHGVVGIDASVAEQAEIAVELSDAVLFVVDALVGATASDERVVKMLRGSGKPVLLVANKIDDAHLEPEAHSLWSLGLGEPYPVSALHGRGVADLLDAALKVLPETSNVLADQTLVSLLF